MLVNHNEAAMKAALQVGLASWSFSQSQGGGKMTVNNLEVQDVAIENGVTTVHLKGKIRYKKSTGFPQFSVSGTIKFSVQPQLPAYFVEGVVRSASVSSRTKCERGESEQRAELAGQHERGQNFLENKIAQQPPIPVTALLQSFIAMGGSLGPTIAA